MFSFNVEKKLGNARLSQLITPHGAIQGPFFQFVATRAAIRGMVFPEDLETMGVQIVLANTYHLHLHPGEEIVHEAGGLHGFMQWNGPITTDSGGYQVFSLGQHVKITPDTVEFRSPTNGDLHVFTPEKAIQIQSQLGPDIIMPLDVCTPFHADKEYIASAVDQTTEWAKRCKAEYERLQADSATARQALYGIVQGGVFPDLREKAARALQDIGFFGYSIGGELQEAGEKQLREVVWQTTRHLPEDAPRYLMGYGRPEDIVEAVRAGVDQFDCVLPVRNARHGQLFYDLNQEELEKILIDPERPVDQAKLYTSVSIKRSEYKNDFSLFSPDHPVMKKAYTKAYVHHLMKAETPSALRLSVMHNIFFYVQLMQAIRRIISEKGSILST